MSAKRHDGGKPPVTEDVDPGNLNEEGVDKLLAMWEPVIQAIVDASRGDLDAADELEDALAKLATKDEWRDLGARLRRIVDGDRDAATLLKGTDVVDGVIVRAALDALGAEHPAAKKADNNELESLDEFLGLVRYACSPHAPETLRDQLEGAAQSMRDGEGVTAETRVLGRAILEILEGVRELDLDGLPEAHAGRVRKLLEKLASDDVDYAT